MKKTLGLAILVLVVILFGCQKQRPAEKEEIPPLAQEIKTRLDSALDDFARGSVGDGAASLLDSVLLVKPAEMWPEGFVDTISSAKKFFSQGEIVTGVEWTSQAMSMIQPQIPTGEEIRGEAPFEAVQAPETAQPAPVAEALRDTVSAAQGEFEKGNADRGVVLILEALMLLAPRAD